MSSDCTTDSGNQSPDVSGDKAVQRPAVTLKKLFQEYTRENPEVVAACFFLESDLYWVGG
jgi:hypothetical protein